MCKLKSSHAEDEVCPAKLTESCYCMKFCDTWRRLFDKNDGFTAWRCKRLHIKRFHGKMIVVCKEEVICMSNGGT